jgi:hypothetical protein
LLLDGMSNILKLQKNQRRYFLRARENTIARPLLSGNNKPGDIILLGKSHNNEELYE